MPTALVLAILAGVLSALPLFVVMAEPSGLLLVLLAPLPLFLVGLSQGLTGVAIAGAVTVSLVGLKVGIPAALGSLAILAAPSAFLVRQAMLNRPATAAASRPAIQESAAGEPSVDSSGAAAIEWYPLGPLVGWLTGIGMIWLVFAGLLIGSSGGESFESTIRSDLLRTLEATLPQASPDQLVMVAGAITPIAVGAGLVSWLLLLAVNGVLAQGVLVRFGRNLRPTPDIAGMSLPRWLTMALAAALIAAFLGSGDFAFAAKNLAIILLLPFFFAGLSVIHAWTRRTNSRVMVLAVFYAVVILFSWPAALVTGLGLIDQWANLRRRAAAPDPGQEEE